MTENTKDTRKSLLAKINFRVINVIRTWRTRLASYQLPILNAGWRPRPVSACRQGGSHMGQSQTQMGQKMPHSVTMESLAAERGQNPWQYFSLDMQFKVPLTTQSERVKWTANNAQHRQCQHIFTDAFHASKMTVTFTGDLILYPFNTSLWSHAAVKIRLSVQMGYTPHETVFHCGNDVMHVKSQRLE